MVIPIKTDDPVRAFFQVLASVFQLAPKEIEILTELYRLDPELPARTPDRKTAAENLGFKTVQGINTYISSFVKRGILVKEGKKYRFHPAFKIPKGKSYTLTLKISERER